MVYAVGVSSDVGPGCIPGFAASLFCKVQVAVLVDREGFLFFSPLHSQRM